MRGPGDVLYVVYHSDKSGDFDVYLRCSTDKGVTWQPEMNLFTAASRTGSQTFPKAATTLAADGSTIRLVVGFKTVTAAAPNGDPAIVRLTGPTLATPCAVNQAAPEAFGQVTRVEDQVDVDVDQAGNVYLAYHRDPGGAPDDHEIGFMEIPNGSSTPTRLFAFFSQTGDMANPAIIASGANDTSTRVAITMKELETGGMGDGTSDIGLFWSLDGGQSWELGNQVSPVGVAASEPSLDFAQFSGPDIYHAWKQGNDDVFVRVVDISTPTLTTITPATKVNTTPGILSLGGISAFANDGQAMVLFSAGFPNPNIFSAFTTNTGATWAENTVTTAANTQNFPRSAIGSSYAVYNSDQDLAGTTEVYFSRDVTGGVTTTRIESLAAANVESGSVEVSWRLVNPTDVSSMLVTREESQAVGQELVPGLGDTYSVVDEAPSPSSVYWLEVHLVSGTVEQHGPVSPAEMPARKTAGCGQGWMSAALVIAAVRTRRLRRRSH